MASLETSAAIAKETREVVEMRAKLRDCTKEIALGLEGLEKVSPEDIEALDVP